MKDFMVKRLTVELDFLKRQLFNAQTQKELYEKEEKILKEQIRMIQLSLNSIYGSCKNESEEEYTDPFSF